MVRIAVDATRDASESPLEYLDYWSHRFKSLLFVPFFFFSSRRRHTRCLSDWSSDVCSSDLGELRAQGYTPRALPFDVLDGQVRNIEVEIAGSSAASEIVLVGAHYDSVTSSPGDRKSVV